MPDVLLFGATGFTGRLTAHALARRGVSFAIAGRDATKLGRLADELDPTPEIRVAAVGDVEALTDALRDVKVVISCVGPFLHLGETAVEAALRARVNYLDSTGEGPFIGRLIQERHYAAREAGICIAPAMGFDEVPADVAVSLSCEGFKSAEVALTYAVAADASSGSRGTLRTGIDILTSRGPWLEDGVRTTLSAGERSRWSPLPPPLGPKRALSFPFAESHLAPLHLPLRTFGTYVAASRGQQLALRPAVPLLRATLGIPPFRAIVDKVVDRFPEGPVGEARRTPFTLLAEARDVDGAWRNVAVSGRDVYGLTAEFLTTGAIEMSRDDFSAPGVRAPVDAVGLETWQKVFTDNDVNIDIYEPSEGA